MIDPLFNLTPEQVQEMMIQSEEELAAIIRAELAQRIGEPKQEEPKKQGKLRITEKNGFLIIEEIFFDRPRLNGALIHNGEVKYET